MSLGSMNILSVTNSRNVLRNNFKKLPLKFLVRICFSQIEILFIKSILLLLIQVNGNHETMNVEGDFRYVDTGAFDECNDFLEYLGDYGDNWEEAFVDWISISKRYKEDRQMSQISWGPWNLVKVLKFSVSSVFLFPIAKCYS